MRRIRSALPPLVTGLIAAMIGFCLMAFIPAIETVDDVAGITRGGAGRDTPRILGASASCPPRYRTRAPPEELAGEATEVVSGGLAGHGESAR